MSANPPRRGWRTARASSCRRTSTWFRRRTTTRSSISRKDPIDAYIDGGWVTADGTTLGADNGIGVASILAVLEDDTLAHGPLEALFTATEETGMDGANGLEKGLLHGDILLNLDSEEEGELYVGCAGGLDANMTFGYKAEPTPAGGYTAAKISVRGSRAVTRASRSSASAPTPTRCCSAF